MTSNLSHLVSPLSPTFSVLAPSFFTPLLIFASLVSFPTCLIPPVSSPFPVPVRTNLPLPSDLLPFFIALHLCKRNICYRNYHADVPVFVCLRPVCLFICMISQNR